MVSRSRDTRRCPIPHYHCEAPGCRWCGKPVESARGARWHAECLAEHHLCTHQEPARKALAKRDGARCWLCGTTPFRWKRGPEIGYVGWGRDHRPPLVFDLALGPYCEVEWVTALQVDHVIPLWKVRNLPDQERVLFFMLENLILLCPPCHKRKTAEEHRDPNHPSRGRWFTKDRKSSRRK